MAPPAPGNLDCLLNRGLKQFDISLGDQKGKKGVTSRLLIINH
jgi:hypothetical protein